VSGAAAAFGIPEGVAPELLDLGDAVLDFLVGRADDLRLAQVLGAGIGRDIRPGHVAEVLGVDLVGTLAEQELDEQPRGVRIARALHDAAR
jgi:hypothetical protein